MDERQPGRQQDTAASVAQPGEFPTVREAARVLKVSMATVYKLSARGELGHVRVVNVIRIPAEVLRTGVHSGD